MFFLCVGGRVGDPRFPFPAMPTLYDPSPYVQVGPVNTTGCHSHDLYYII